MVPFANRMWYHFPYQYGTIFPINMVPFSIAIWYHILLGFRPYWKWIRLICLFKIILFQSQKGYGYFACWELNQKDMRPSTTCWETRRTRRKKDCMWGFNTMNTRRCVALFVTQGLRPRKANASAKHVKDCMWGGNHCFSFARYAHCIEC